MFTSFSCHCYGDKKRLVTIENCGAFLAESLGLVNGVVDDRE